MNTNKLFNDNDIEQVCQMGYFEESDALLELQSSKLERLFKTVDSSILALENMNKLEYIAECNGGYLDDPVSMITLESSLSQVGLNYPSGDVVIYTDEALKDIGKSIAKKIMDIIREISSKFLIFMNRVDVAIDKKIKVIAETINGRSAAEISEGLSKKKGKIKMFNIKTSSPTPRSSINILNYLRGNMNEFVEGDKKKIKIIRTGYHNINWGVIDKGELFADHTAIKPVKVAYKSISESVLNNIITKDINSLKIVKGNIMKGTYIKGKIYNLEKEDANRMKNNINIYFRMVNKMALSINRMLTDVYKIVKK